MPVVWTEEHRLHDAGGQVWVGVRLPGDEVAARADVIHGALVAVGARVLAPRPHGDAPLLAVHSPLLLDYLRDIYDDWVAAGFPDDPGQDRVVPYVFPTYASGVDPERVPAAVQARPGRFCLDTTTLIGPGTYRAARAAVDTALTGADLLLDGEVAAYAAVRPPGHHAGTEVYGGSCYLNNAAVAARWLADRSGGRVAVVDLDAHHGNGTQQVFYACADVLYASVHVDPGAGWFPHFVGFREEAGSGAGAGLNVNRPLAPGSGDEPWLAAVAELREAVARFAPAFVVCSLGVDAAEGDPESPLRVSARGFAAAGDALAGLAPVLFVQEGGYDLATLADLVAATLTGFESGSEEATR